MESNPYEAPKSDINVASGNNDILKFDRFSAWGVFGLSIITLGFYPIYWLYKNSNIANSLHEQKISMPLVYTLMVLFFVTLLTGFTNNETMLIISGIANLVYFVIYLIVLFTLRSRLQDIMDNSGGINSKLSGILTFFFNAIYLQYKINEKIDSINQQ